MKRNLELYVRIIFFCVDVFLTIFNESNWIQYTVRRLCSAARYTSGLSSTSVGHKNNLFRVSHTGATVDTLGCLHVCHFDKKHQYSSFVIIPKSRVWTVQKQTIVSIFLYLIFKRQNIKFTVT